ncbi:MAG: nucleotidyltransferase domain-containing protein [Solirubrobacterales bacterium]
MTVLAELASEVGVNERTLRRAVRDGVIRADRRSQRSLDISLLEREFVRQTWRTIAALRESLRTESNVRLALLYGSVASGTHSPRSDCDLIVELHDPSLERLADLGAKLSVAIDRPVDLTRLSDARRDPAFLSSVIEEARPLIDRDGIWLKLRRQQPMLRRRGAAEQERGRAAALRGIDHLLSRLT